MNKETLHKGVFDNMKKQVFEEFLDGKILTKDFLRVLADEIAVYSKKTDVHPVHIDGYEAEESLAATKKRINRLLQLYLKGDIDKVTLTYFCDVVDLYPFTDYEDALVEEIVGRIANYEIHGGLEEESFRNMAARLEMPYGY